MDEPLAPEPQAPAPDLALGEIPTAEALQLSPDPCPQRQRGGRESGLQELSDFLTSRVQRYARSISSPVVAFQGCSRLSPYLTWGCLSMREVVQASRTLSGRGVSSFGSRLHWHCHFIQSRK